MPPTRISIALSGIRSGDTRDPGAPDPDHPRSVRFQIHEDRGAGLGLTQTLGQIADSVWFDADGDEFGDLWVTGTNGDHVMCGSADLVAQCWQDPEIQQPGSRVLRGDLEGDGDDDVAVVTLVEVRIYRNDGGAFTLVARPKITQPEGLYDVDWVELDGCAGDELVLTVTSFEAPMRWELYRWDGNELVEYDEHTAPLEGWTNWADFDADGDLDPLIHLSLYARQGMQLTFIRSFDAYGSPTWGDYDGDGDPDLAMFDLNAADNLDLVIVRNDGGTAFVEVYREAIDDVTTLSWGRCGADATVPCFPFDELPATP